MKTVTVSGKNSRHNVLIYAISTCAWCKLTKQFLRDNNIKYDYIDVDLCVDEDREEIRNHIRSMGGSLAYPTIIIENKTMITGFHKDELKKALEI